MRDAPAAPLRSGVAVGPRPVSTGEPMIKEDPHTCAPEQHHAGRLRDEGGGYDEIVHTLRVRGHDSMQVVHQAEIDVWRTVQFGPAGEIEDERV